MTQDLTIEEAADLPGATGEVEEVIAAVVLAANGHEQAAALVLGTLEGDHRIAAEAGVRAAIREQKRRRLLDENRRVASLKLPEVPVSDAVKAKMKLAQGEMDKAVSLTMTAAVIVPRKVRKAIAAHEALAKRLFREAQALATDESDLAWVQHAMAESERLAAGRGERFTVTALGLSSGQGSGLENALEKGYLVHEHGPDRSEDLYRTGLHYRQAFEIAGGQTTSKGDGGGGFGPKGPQVRIVQAGMDLATMRKDLTARQVKVLDAICGEGLGLFQTARRHGMGTPSTRNALRGGLTAAMGALREARKSPEAVTTTDDLQAAHAAVARAGRGL